MCKKRVSILTTEDSAPLRSRAIRRLVFLQQVYVSAAFSASAQACRKGAKRLRGWQLEYESGRAPKARDSKALEKAHGAVAESALVNKLLNLWAKGALSATLLQSLATSTIQDGVQHQDLVAIAQTGNWGSSLGIAIDKS